MSRAELDYTTGAVDALEMVLNFFEEVDDVCGAVRKALGEMQETVNEMRGYAV